MTTWLFTHNLLLTIFLSLAGALCSSGTVYGPPETVLKVWKTGAKIAVIGIVTVAFCYIAYLILRLLSAETRLSSSFAEYLAATYLLLSMASAEILMITSVVTAFILRRWLSRPLKVDDTPYYTGPRSWEAKLHPNSNGRIVENVERDGNCNPDQVANDLPRQRQRQPIKVRRAIWLRYGQKCYYCGLALRDWRGENMHLDHRIPFSKGGRDCEENLVPACPECNQEKGSKRFPEIEPGTASGKRLTYKINRMPKE